MPSTPSAALASRGGHRVAAVLDAARRPSPDRCAGHSAISASPSSAPGREHRPVGERVAEVDAPLDLGVGVVGDDDHRVLVEERAGPAGRVHHPLELRGRRWRSTSTCACGPCLWECVSLSGSEQQQEVEEVVLDHVRRRRSRRAGRACPACRAASGTASRGWRRCRRRTARAGPSRGGATARRPAASARARARPRGGCGRGRSGTSCRPCARRRRRASRTPSARRPAGARMFMLKTVSVSCLAMPKRRAAREARAVLDVALLGARVPVHRRDVMDVLEHARGDRRRRTPA